MDATSELDKDNIISATIEELSEEERQDYLVAEEHVKAQFLKGFKKDRCDTLKIANLNYALRRPDRKLIRCKTLTPSVSPPHGRPTRA
jgi:hypothetical protein